MNAPTSAQGTLALRETQSSVLSPAVGQLLAVGRAHMWPFQPLGQAPMLQEPIRLGDWLLVPAQQDSAPIPARAMARIQAIYAAGARPQGFVVVHETPMLLKAPAETSPRPQDATLPVGTAVANAVASDVLSAVAGVLSAFVSVILPAMFLVAAAMVDPILVAVTEDGYWIEIDRWKTE